MVAGVRGRDRSAIITVGNGVNQSDPTDELVYLYRWISNNLFCVLNLSQHVSGKQFYADANDEIDWEMRTRAFRSNVRAKRRNLG